MAARVLRLRRSPSGSGSVHSAGACLVNHLGVQGVAAAYETVLGHALSGDLRLSQPLGPQRGQLGHSSRAAAVGESKPLMHVISTRGLGILDQLRMEEALLRGDPLRRNWCVINHGIEEPAVVMGISGNPEELLFLDQVKARGIPVLRRFTGGGTVVVDRDTIFVTLICNSSAVPSLQMYPRPIMSWTEGLYGPLFPPEARFSLLETDYALGNLKFGGNAQAIIKDRWLHHTSFLWNYDTALMNSLLRSPKKAPEYRKRRSHEEFLCKLQPLFPCKADFVGDLVGKCLPLAFELELIDVQGAIAGLTSTHLCGTKLVALAEH